MTVAAIAVAGVGAAATIGGTMMANSSKNKASGQAQAAQQENMLQQQSLAEEARNRNVPIFNQAKQEALGYLSNYTDAGNRANTALQQGMGLLPDANGNYTDTLNRNFNAQDYQQDPGYTPMTSNQLTREQYSQMYGVPALVGNTLTANEWQNDGTGTYTATPRTLEELQATPGYQFQLQQGLQSVNNSAAAKGSLMSGRTMKELNNYAQGVASTGFADAWSRGQQAYQNAFARKQQRFQQGQEGYQNAFNNQQTQYGQGQQSLQNAYNRYTNNQGNQYSRLAGLVGTGANAAGTSAGIVSQNAQNVAQQNQNVSNTMSGASSNYADNTGNIAYGRGQNNANMYTGLGNSLTDLAGRYLAGSSNNATLGGGEFDQNNNAINTRRLGG